MSRNINPGQARRNRRARARRSDNMRQWTKAYVKTAVNKIGERKFRLDTYNALTPYFSSTAAYPMFDVAEGTGEDDRIGNQIRPTSMQIRFSAYRGLADSVLRLVVFRWKERDTTKTTSAILDQTSIGATNYINAPLLLEAGNRKRFDILYDKTFILDDGKQNTIHRIVNVKVNAKKVDYTAAAVTQNRTNEIYWGFIADVALASAPSVYVQAIGHYRDL